MSAAAATGERPGTGCFYANVDGSIACTVHCAYWPCEHSGQPASPQPVHMGDERYSRAEMIDAWRATTGGQRPLIIHHGGDLATGDHRVDATGACWCCPHAVDPDPVIA